MSINYEPWIIIRVSLSIAYLSCQVVRSHSGLSIAQCIVSVITDEQCVRRGAVPKKKTAACNERALEVVEETLICPGTGQSIIIKRPSRRRVPDGSIALIGQWGSRDPVGHLGPSYFSPASEIIPSSLCKSRPRQNWKRKPASVILARPWSSVQLGPFLLPLTLQPEWPELRCPNYAPRFPIPSHPSLLHLPHLHR